MDWRTSVERFGLPPRHLWRGLTALGCTAAILGLGSSAIDHIAELYNGLCSIQGNGMASFLARGDRQGYCTGIDGYLEILDSIMVVAAVAVPCALGGFWHYRDRCEAERLKYEYAPLPHERDELR
jgi:hypothetical protein